MHARVRRLFVWASIAGSFLVGGAKAAEAQTFPVTATVRFETGLRKLATITLSGTPTVNWGDGSDVQNGLLVDCRGFLNQTCDVYGTHRYTTLRDFLITISYTTPGPFGGPASVSTTAHVDPVGDFIVLSIGDSVASGEGNPLVPRSRVWEGPIVNRGLWDDPASSYGDFGEGCHRTSLAGPGLGTSSLKATNPTSGITFIHVACSGAKVGNVITQLKEARRSIESSRMQAGGDPGADPLNVDVLLISVGANNIGDGFGSLVLACADPTTDCSTDPTLAQTLSQSFDALPGDFQALANEINVPTEATRGTVSDIYITEYFDPTRDETGEFPTLASCPLGGLLESEWTFLYNNMVVPLNAAVASAAGTHKWHLVGGIEDAFRTHGYCATPADNRWVVSLGESGEIQGDQLGTGHPNPAGQQTYAARIRNRVIVFTPPKTTASALAGGQPYTFGAWTPHDVFVSLIAQNPISESGVGNTYFAVDDPGCTPQTLATCTLYTGPFSISTSGTHTVSFFSQNAFVGIERLNTVLVRIDKDPPRMTCTATPDVLWAPNNKLVPVATHVTVVDDVFGPAPFTLLSLTTSEGSVVEDIEGFVLGGPDTEGWLRAKRLGTGPGRHYGLTYQSADPLGNVGTCTTIVSVPHDQRR